jgi:hypothetical protein
MKQRFFGNTFAPCALENPYGNPRPNDAGLTSTHIGARVDPGKVVSQILNYPLEELRFLPARQGREELLYFLQTVHGET